MKKPWSNLASVVYKRTYARQDTGKLENWEQTVERVIRGNISGHDVSSKEANRLHYFLSERKAGPAGRGWWFSGAPAQATLGGVALNNCWAVTADDWMAFVIAQDLLMLGGGVGMSVEHRYTSKLPKIKKGVVVQHKSTKDASFIVPDSREGWCELVRRVLEAYFVTGKSFDYSTVCIRGAGERIKGFGGTSSGPLPLITLVEKLSALLSSREGRALRPIDAMDVLCNIGEMVVAGNVRRSAIIILGDGFDKDYLKAKRWDLGPVPTQRAMANLSVVCDDIEDLHPLFWKTYEQGEPFGIVNRTNIQQYGRMGEKKKDTAVAVNPCVPAGTEILTSTGYKAIETLLGQTVEVWNGFEFSPVQPQVTGKNQPLVKVTLDSGRSLICTSGHNFMVQTSIRGAPERITAGKLEPGQALMKVSYPVLREGEMVDPQMAYSQGFYSGDGSSGKRPRSVHLYGEKIDCVPRLLGKSGSRDENQDRWHFGLSFDPQPKEFVPFGWDLTGRLEWLAGILDSDGVELKEGGAQLASIDKDFLLNTQKMLTTMGVDSKVTLMHEGGLRLLPDGRGGTKEYQTQDSWRLLLSAVPVQQLKALGLRCERLSFEKNPNRDASRFVRVVSVEPVGTADVVYCFKEGKRGLGTFEGVVTGQCAEATLEPYEPCNLQEIALPNLSSMAEFEEAARLMHRWGKRVTMEKYHIPQADEVVKRNRRIGTGITGCLQSPLFKPDVLDHVYSAIQDENKKYSKELGINESIRTTVVKPSGTMSKLLDMQGYEGIHAAYSQYYIQRVRFAANDPSLSLLVAAGHHIEPVVRFDGSLDPNTVVVDFYERAPEGAPVADHSWTTWQQLDVLKLAQKHWADQSVSVTVYYKREDIDALKAWLKENLKVLKTISFLCHDDHGFKQAPKEAISEKEYERLSAKVKPVDVEQLGVGVDGLDGLECAGGSCPVK